MAIKYTREEFDYEAGASRNRYEVKSRLGTGDPKRRLLFIYMGLLFAAFVIFLYQYLVGARMSRWLPERSGDAVVVEKDVERGEDGRRHLLVVNVLVPEASATEAGYVEDGPERAARIGPLEFLEIVEVPEADWESVEAGAELRVRYLINMQRNEILVRSLYLDRFGSSAPDDAEPLRP